MHRGAHMSSIFSAPHKAVPHLNSTGNSGLSRRSCGSAMYVCTRPQIYILMAAPREARVATHGFSCKAS